MHPLLAEQRRQLLFLEHRWSTPLASGAQFQTAVKEATKTAKIILGEDPTIVLDWMPPMFAPTTVILEGHEDDTVDMLPVLDCLVSESQMRDSDTFIAEDELDGGDDIDESVTASATILWTIPVSAYPSTVYYDAYLN